MNTHNLAQFKFSCNLVVMVRICVLASLVVLATSQNPDDTRIVGGTDVTAEVSLVDYNLEKLFKKQYRWILTLKKYCFELQ